MVFRKTVTGKRQPEFNQEDLVSAAETVEVLASMQTRDSETDVILLRLFSVFGTL
ncbi:hypothetical protein L195_g046939 [Trifolium pratense]|uniref:Uncharacterized protein n=1 Tax=Trifolium pratense TaxID=57577 RepID=A0A2K3MJ51_TRIPR|nr:hypothetical protein L195_g046939 [Trifolium pratense]